MIFFKTLSPQSHFCIVIRYFNVHKNRSDQRNPTCSLLTVRKYLLLVIQCLKRDKKGEWCPLVLLVYGMIPCHVHYPVSASYTNGPLLTWTSTTTSVSTTIAIPNMSGPITVTVTAFLNHIYLRPRLIRRDVRQSEQEAGPRSLAQGRR